jgi:hypothetical protein
MINLPAHQLASVTFPRGQEDRLPYAILCKAVIGSRSPSQAACWRGSRLPTGSGSKRKKIMRDWQQIAVESHYLTAVGVKEALEAGDIHEALRGIDELIDAMRRSEQRAVRSQLVWLMTHILKWHTQPTHCSPSWVATINHARQKIWDSQEETPSITNEVIQGMWDRCFQRAKQQAEDETGQPISLTSLSWDEVFHTRYRREHP